MDKLFLFFVFSTVFSKKTLFANKKPHCSPTHVCWRTHQKIEISIAKNKIEKNLLYLKPNGKIKNIVVGEQSICGGTIVGEQVVRYSCFSTTHVYK